MELRVIGKITALLLFVTSANLGQNLPAEASYTPKIKGGTSQQSGPIGKDAACTKTYYEARAKYGKMTPEEMVVAGILIGAIGLGITAAVRAEAGATAARQAELECLTAKGLAPSQNKSTGDPAITAPGASRLCSNRATSCSGALSSCLANCRERNAGAGCQKDCSQAVQNCRSTGTWQTTNCLKTGMTQ